MLSNSSNGLHSSVILTQIWSPLSLTFSHLTCSQFACNETDKLLSVPTIRYISECSSGILATLSIIIDSGDNDNSFCMQFLKRFKQGFNLHPNTIGGLEWDLELSYCPVELSPVIAIHWAGVQRAESHVTSALASVPLASVSQCDLVFSILFHMSEKWSVFLSVTVHILSRISILYSSCCMKLKS